MSVVLLATLASNDDDDEEKHVWEKCISLSGFLGNF